MDDQHPDPLTDISDFLDPPRVFGKDLADSHGDRARWNQFYQRRFPDCTIVNGEANAMLQGLGADVILRRPTGKEILIEEKVRASAFGDCLIEIWSKFYSDGDPRNRVGWSLHPDKHPDFLAYAVRPLSRCWLVPFDVYRDLARRAVADPFTYATGGLRRSRTVAANGDAWTTVHTSIEWEYVYQALCVAASDVCYPW
jgi:hypothetical protein